jgi:hypothetical protein
MIFENPPVQSSFIILILAIAFEVFLRWQPIPYINPFKGSRINNFLLWAVVRLAFYGSLLLLNYLFF